MGVIAESSLSVDLGDDVEVTALFVDENGDDGDPATVTITLVSPDGVSTDYVQGTDPEVSNPVVGSYVGVFVPDQVGRWTWRVHGTGGGIEAATVGAFAVAPATAAATAYARWGMTVDAAVDLTRVTALSSDVLHAAEQDITDWLGWAPDPTEYVDPITSGPTHRAEVFGRAVAWQAAYRVEHPPSASDGGERVTMESLPDYTVQYAARHPSGPVLVAPRARSLLVRFGWRRMTGAATIVTLPPGLTFQTD